MGAAICTSKVARCTSKYLKTNIPICEMTKMDTNTTLRALGHTLYTSQQKPSSLPFSQSSSSSPYGLSQLSFSSITHWALHLKHQDSRVKDEFISDCYMLGHRSHSLFISIHTLYKGFSLVPRNQWTSKSSFQIAIAMSRYAMTSFFDSLFKLRGRVGSVSS